MPYKNKDDKVACAVRYRLKNGDELRAKDRLKWRDPIEKKRVCAYLDSLSGGYMLLKRNSVRGSHALEISFDEYREIVKGQKCFYCGTDLYGRCGHKIDRLDNRLGYLKSNVVPCCSDCNCSKGVLERYGWHPPEIIEVVRGMRANPRTHCIYGHALQGTGYCLTCKRERCKLATRRYRARRKLQSAVQT